MINETVKQPLNDETWREYDFGSRIYRIENPVDLTYTVGGLSHKITDQSGITHCVPAPGVGGCVLRLGPTKT